MKRESRQLTWSAASSEARRRFGSVRRRDISRAKRRRASLGSLSAALHKILLLAILSPIMAEADGGFVRLREDQGPFVVTVFTPFEVCQSTLTDMSVLVQRRNTGEVVLDATVDLCLIPPDGVVIHPDEPICGSANKVISKALAGTTNNSLTVRALRARGTPQFLYAAQLVLPIAGVWRLHASIREAGQAVNITGPLSVGSPPGRLESLWLYLLFPPLGIALFAINQWQLKRRMASPFRESTHIQPGRDGLFNLIKSIPPTL
jgi:hypothetical protein